MIVVGGCLYPRIMLPMSKTTKADKATTKRKQPITVTPQELFDLCCKEYSLELDNQGQALFYTNLYRHDDGTYHYGNPDDDDEDQDDDDDTE